MTPGDLTVGGLKVVLETIERGNNLDHENIRKTICATETRLSKQISEGFDGVQDIIDQDLKAKVEKLDTRIGKLENWRYWIAGGLAVIILLVSGLGFALVPGMIESQAEITKHLIQEEQTENWHNTTTTTERGN